MSCVVLHCLVCVCVCRLLRPVDGDSTCSVSAVVKKPERLEGSVADRQNSNRDTMFVVRTTISAEMITNEIRFLIQKPFRKYLRNKRKLLRNLLISKTIGPHKITVLTDVHLYSLSLFLHISLFSHLCLLTSITLLTSISSHMSLVIHMSLIYPHVSSHTCLSPSHVPRRKCLSPLFSHVARLFFSLLLPIFLRFLINSKTKDLCL